MTKKVIIPDDKYEKLSDIMLSGTRAFNREIDWNEWTTSGWRMMSNELLRELLDELFPDGWTLEQWKDRNV